LEKPNITDRLRLSSGVEEEEEEEEEEEGKAGKRGLLVREVDRADRRRKSSRT